MNANRTTNLTTVVYLHHKTRYGNVVYVPACDFSRMICELKETKEVSLRDINYLRSKGFTIKVTPTPAQQWDIAPEQCDTYINDVINGRS